MRERESHAVPGGFGGKEWDEDAVHVGRRYALAAVGDLYQRPPSSRAIHVSRSCDLHAAYAGSFANRFSGVANQIEQSLTQHAVVCADDDARRVLRVVCVSAVSQV